MRPYQDKLSGLWKWGKNGKAVYNSRTECEKAGMRMVCDRLIKVRDHLNTVIHNHGRG